MNLRINTSFPRFGFALAADLEGKQLGPITVSVDAYDRFALQYRSSLPSRALSTLLDALWPLSPDDIEAVPNLAEAEVVLWLGEGRLETPRGIRITSDSDCCARQWAETFAGLDLTTETTGCQLCTEDLLRYQGVSRLSLQMVRWYLVRAGFAIQVREEADLGHSFSLSLRDPELARLPLRQRYPLEVSCDDPAVGADLLARLVSRNFRCLPLRMLSPDEALAIPFLIQSGPFHSDHSLPDYQALASALTDGLHQVGVDLTRFPLRCDKPTQSVVTRVIIPVAACRSGRRPPYAGPYPERFQLTIVTDRPEGIDPLRMRLLEAGFQQVTLEQRPSLLDDTGEPVTGEFAPGFALAWNEAGSEPAIATLLRETMRAAMEEVHASGFFLRTLSSCGGGEGAVRLYFPLRGIEDGSLLNRVADPGRFNVRLSTPQPDEWHELLAELRTWGFQRCEIRESTDESTSLSYGGAPLELIERLRTTVRRFSSVDLRPNKAWSENDCDIWFYLPTRHGISPGTPPTSATEESATATTPDSQKPTLPEDPGPQLETWAFGEAGAEAASAFAEVTSEQVRIGGVSLLRHQGPRHDLAPHPSSFGHFCLDRLTALTLEHVATSVLLREPCLLEGETSTSKTSSILYLAALLNQPVVRINLNGQTDTGELIGRFVPQHLTLELPLTSQELYAAADLLEEETQRILEKAQRENRPLSRVEIQQIMAQEDMVSHPWRWEDGLVPEAMRQGWWVLLDEVNLAEPQILERLNSVLEQDPTLVLTEYDNAVIGGGGTPVHAHFRIFATMNPAEYAGRSVLSPAYRDRWRGYRFVPRPGEGEYLAMLRFLVYGEQPDCVVHGVAYRGRLQEPRYPQFATLPNAEAYLEALARFHVALESAVGQAAESARIGSRRRERYVFTRRGLLSILEYLASPLCQHEEKLDARAVRRSLLRYYLGRLATTEDRAMVVQLLDAHGIGPNTWTLPD